MKRASSTLTTRAHVSARRVPEADGVPVDPGEDHLPHPSDGLVGADLTDERTPDSSRVATVRPVSFRPVYLGRGVPDRLAASLDDDRAAVVVGPAGRPAFASPRLKFCSGSPYSSSRDYSSRLWGARSMVATCPSCYTLKRVYSAAIGHHRRRRRGTYAWSRQVVVDGPRVRSGRTISRDVAPGGLSRRREGCESADGVGDSTGGYGGEPGAIRWRRRRSTTPPRRRRGRPPLRGAPPRHRPS